MGAELRLAGRKVLVTGGVGGIGAACARALALEGAAVALADVRLDAAQEVARGIAAGGGLATALEADVTNREACRLMVGTAAERMGGLDGLVNNAISYGPRGAGEDDGWDATLESGLSAVWAASMEAAPLLAASGRGAVVSVASVAGARFGFSTAGYSAAKAGVVGLTRWLAKELGPRGVRANCVCPGLIETPLWHTPGREYPPMFRRWADMTPLGRAGRAEEVARVVVFLLGEEAGFITGQDIAVDGGFCVGMRFEGG